MKKVKIMKTNRGIQFRLSNKPSSPVYTKGEFIVSEGGYQCFKSDNCNIIKVISKDRFIFVNEK